MDTAKVSLQLSVILAEYKRITDELGKRIDFLDKNINYQLLLLAAVTTVTATLLKDDKQELVGIVLGLASVMFSMLSIYNAVNNVFIFELSNYLDKHMRPGLNKLLESNELLVFESYIIDTVSPRTQNKILKTALSQWGLLLPFLFLLLFILKVPPTAFNVVMGVFASLLVVGLFFLNLRQRKAINPPDRNAGIRKLLKELS